LSGHTWIANNSRNNGAKGYMDFNPTNGYSNSIELFGKYNGTGIGYAYLKSDSISGGIDSIAFDWQAYQANCNTTQLKFVVRIYNSHNDSITLANDNQNLYSGETTGSDNSINYNLSTGTTSPYSAYTYGAPHHVFSAKNIHFVGKFVIRIWDLTNSYALGCTVSTTADYAHRMDIANLKWKNTPSPTISYPITNSYHLGDVVKLTPNVTGATPITYAISPDLNVATGLNFNTSTGEISGAPTKIYSGNFTVTATNTYGKNLSMFVITVKNQKIASGYVKTTLGDPVVSAVISDGYNVYKTDANGYYSISANDSAQFVSISLPEKYAVPTDEAGHPVLYYKLNATGPTIHDFILTPFTPDELKADSTHVLIGVGDPQSFSNYTTWRYENETIKDIKQLRESYPTGTHFYGAEVGDIAWSDSTILQPMYDVTAKTGFPVFFVEGNHDQWAGQKKYNEIYGPDHYSFNRGKIHYITFYNYLLDSNLSSNPYPSKSVIDWIKKDLAGVPADKAIVFLVHVPIAWNYGNISQTIYDLVNNRETVTHFISGHTHTISNTIISDKLFDHTLPAAMGANWAGNTTTNGAPNGYGVFQAGDLGLNSWYYKGVNESRNSQFYAYPLDHMKTGDNSTDSIIVNVWNYDPAWTVNIYENGVKHPMEQYSGIDPDAFDFYALGQDIRPDFPSTNSGWTVSRNPGYSDSGNMFYYTPTDSTADFKVEVTDRFGEIYTKRVLKHQMVAAFDKKDNIWQYKMNFDSLSLAYNSYDISSGESRGTWVQGHTPEGWYACTTGNTLATSPTPTWAEINWLNVDNGSLSGSGLYSYGDGVTGVFGQNSPKRGLGSLCDINNRNIFYGVMLENNTGDTIHSLDISYIGEMWRAGQSPSISQTLEFSYGTISDNEVINVRDRKSFIGQISGAVYSNLSFTTPTTNTAVINSLKNASIIGTDLANSKNVSGNLSVNVPPGEVIMLRWKCKQYTTYNNGTAIDNLVITPHYVLDDVSSVHENRNNIEIYSIDKMLCFDTAPNDYITVLDISGRIIYHGKVNTETVNLSGCVQSGIYLVKLRNQVTKIIFK
jgi:hypothetical protein